MAKTGKKKAPRPIRYIQYGQQHNVLLKAIDIAEKLSEISGDKRKVQELQEQARLLRMAYIPDQVKQVMDDPKGKFIIAFSGGKDSVAMFTYLHFTLKVPLSKIELWHHEIDGHGEDLYDWPCTPSYCEAFAKAFKTDLLFSYREGGIIREIYRENEGLQPVHFQDKPGGEYIRLESKPGSSTRRKFPAVSADLKSRWCSATVKIDVMSRAIANSRRFDEGNFIVCSGERRQESDNRATYLEIEKHRTFSQRRNIWQWRPILEWSEGQVWEEYRIHRIQPHPCYELGYSRCSCFICIFLDNDGWASTKDLDPKRVERIADVEKDIEFTLYDKMTIEQKAAKGISLVTPAAKERWQKEALSEFTSPIIIEKFNLPPGAFRKGSAGSV